MSFPKGQFRTAQLLGAGREEVLLRPEWVPFRLVRADDLPATNPHNLTYVFGLQDVDQQIVPGERRPDGAYLFDFMLRARPAKVSDRPDFGGSFASGTAKDRFVYLS